jgi:hypothetical protein
MGNHRKCILKQYPLENRVRTAMSEFLESKAASELKHTLFNIQDNATNRHILNLIDIWILFVQNKPIMQHLLLEF